MEDALYEIASIRLFAGLSLGSSIPDHSTVLKFRHLQERHSLARKIFSEVSNWLNVLIKEGILMGATIIEAPNSTNNKADERDSEMHQAKKRQSMALWRESSYWCACSNRFDAHLYNDRSQ